MATFLNKVYEVPQAHGLFSLHVPFDYILLVYNNTQEAKLAHNGANISMGGMSLHALTSDIFGSGRQDFLTCFSAVYSALIDVCSVKGLCAQFWEMCSFSMTSLAPQRSTIKLIVVVEAVLVQFEPSHKLLQSSK